MSNDVLITPASRKIELKDSSGNVDAKIETDSSGNLLITNAGGDISIGDTTSDVFIGDGTNSVDIVFEQNGEIRGTTGVVLTLGDANTTLRTGTDLSLNSNDITNVGNISTTDMSLSGTMTLTGLINFTPDTADILRFDGQSVLKRLTTNGGLRLGHDDCVLIAAGDTTAVMEANVGGAPEKVVVGAEGGLEVYAFPNNDTTWSNRDYFIFNGSGITVNGTTIVNTSGQWTGSSSGLKGEPGAKGQKGEVGSKGQKGDAGAKGQKGDAGAKGQKGDAGAKGQKGEVGAAGPTGTNLSGDISTSGARVEAGRGTGSVAMTTNDGYGNANLTFNHKNGVPDVTGSSARIETSVDSATASMIFELGNSTTSGTAVSLTTVASMYTDRVNIAKKIQCNGNDVIGTSGQWLGSSSGLKGEPGASVKGQKGEPGAKGATGTATKGQKGEVGAKGDAGASVKGQKGQKGEAGASVKGQKGEIGAKGNTGGKGQKGEIGAKGATGTATKGQKGEIGLTDAPYGAVPAYSNSNVNTINWNATEEAMMLESSSDTQIGAAFPAFRVNLASNETHKLSVKLKGNTTGSSGIYIRVYEYNAALPSGKVAVSNSATYGLVQEDTSGKTNWRENQGVTTSWVTHEYTYTPTSGAQWASIVILNWSGFGTNVLYIRDPMWQLIGSSGAKGQKGEVGQKGQKGAAGAKGQKGEVGQKGQKGEAGASVKGQKGEVGQKGAPGAKGQKGESGASVKGQKGEVGTFSNSSNITVTKSLPKLVLDSANSGDNWTAQGAQISLGESGDGGSAALHLTYTGDGYGRVGMGTLSSAGIPAYAHFRFQYNANTILCQGTLDIQNSGTLKLAGTTRLTNGGLLRAGSGSAGAPGISFNADTNCGIYRSATDEISISTGGAQRLKFFNSGVQNIDGYVQLFRTANAPLIVDRLGTSGSSGTGYGDQINLKARGTKNGAIGYKIPYGGIGYRYSGDWGLGYYTFSTSRYVQPCDTTGAIRDNQVDLGSTGSRFDDVYATNGTIQTSDINEKQDIQALTTAEQAAAVACKALVRRFRWIDSVEEKGDNARYHFGVIAQDVEAAFTAQGLDAGRYGLFIRTNWWEHENTWYPSEEAAPEGAVERSRLGIRYNQLLAFIISAL